MQSKRTNKPKDIENEKPNKKIIKTGTSQPRQIEVYDTLVVAQIYSNDQRSGCPREGETIDYGLSNKKVTQSLTAWVGHASVGVDDGDEDDITVLIIIIIHVPLVASPCSDSRSLPLPDQIDHN